jgi:hypothetical protein
VNAKKSKQQVKAKNIDNLTPEQQQKIREADARRDEIRKHEN